MGDHQDAMMQGRTKTQNRANVIQLKLIGQSHPTGLTFNLLKLFEPRPPLVYKPPLEKRKCPPYTGMAQFVSNFAEKGDPEYQPPVQEAETTAQKKERIHKLRLEEGSTKAAKELEKYDPNNDPNISGDPYKTLFVARLNYETTESKAKREFEAYGPIKQVRLVNDKVTNKPRGYAFIEYMHTRDMKVAYKQADGKKLDNRRVLVDVERGRTVPNWRPRRLGGGLGTTRVGGEDSNQKYAGREQQQSGGPSRSEEPGIHDDRHGERDSEKPRERGRDRERERERSSEHANDKSRDRDHKEDRHHRDRDRDRDKERDRGRDRDRRRDRGRDRDRDRGGDRVRESERDRDRGRNRERDRPRERERDRSRSYQVGDPDQEQGTSLDNREYDYDRVESKHERDRHGERRRKYEHVEPEEDNPEWYEENDHGHKRSETEHDQGRYNQSDRYQDPYDPMEDDNNYFADGATSEKRGRVKVQDLDNEYGHLERSVSRDYE